MAVAKAPREDFVKGKAASKIEIARRLVSLP